MMLKIACIVYFLLPGSAEIKARRGSGVASFHTTKGLNQMMGDGSRWYC